MFISFAMIKFNLIKLYDIVYKLNKSSFNMAFELNYLLTNLVLITLYIVLLN
jgi:hypothetical protein